MASLRPSLLLLLVLPLLVVALPARPAGRSIARWALRAELLLVLWMGLWLHPQHRPIPGGAHPVLLERLGTLRPLGLELALRLDGLSFPWVLGAAFLASAATEAAMGLSAWALGLSLLGALGSILCPDFSLSLPLFGLALGCLPWVPRAPGARTRWGLLGVSCALGMHLVLRQGVGGFPRAFLALSPALSFVGVTLMGLAALVALDLLGLARRRGGLEASLFLYLFGSELLGLSSSTPQVLEGCAVLAGSSLLALGLGLVWPQRHRARGTQAPAVWVAGASLLPGALGSWGHLLILLGALPRHPLLALVAAAFGALWLFGGLSGLRRAPEQEPSSASRADLDPAPVRGARALLALGLLLLLGLGLWPRPLLDLLDRPALDLHRRLHPAGTYEVASAAQEP